MIQFGLNDIQSGIGVLYYHLYKGHPFPHVIRKKLKALINSGSVICPILEAVPFQTPIPYEVEFNLSNASDCVDWLNENPNYERTSESKLHRSRKSTIGLGNYQYINWQV